MFGCNNEAYYFYLTNNNYTIYIDENISINNLKINTNLPKIESYEFISNSSKIIIENNIIHASEEGNFEINIIVNFNNKKYSQTFILNVKQKIEDEIIANYYILKIDETKNCFVLILNKSYDTDEILNMDMFEEDGYISCKIVGLKISIFYYKDSSFENELNKFVLKYNIKELIL